ncbi:AI-2E family transporter [Erythrobacter sp. HI0063]|jgi:predicted PurR-regulated permease PerM|uniref:AI-2E family transporter n=1 Tax=Erythrobacter sp. HI0063 TaxID=1822240 RepID=UPI0007C2F1FF|nr:AI-2E family transporter [Erythrobacter sp. HI0063]KZY55965.1 AI-2E family transporter [Erythrobacter sp. HI0063]
MADGDSSADGSADAKGEDRIGTSPSRLTDPVMREEMRRALVWAGVIGLIALTVYISRSLLVVFGALVFAAMIDGGARLLGRILPIARAWRVALVLILSVLFFVWLGYFAGSTISNEAAQFPELVQGQISDLLAWAQGKGLQIDQSQLQNYAGSITSGIGTLTSALGGILGGLTTIVLILIIGIYVAVEPRLYERGVAWMMPRERRDSFHVTVARMAHTLRRLMAGRLLGMFVEGVFTYIMLAWVAPLVGIGAVPMASLLAILTGLLAFVPNLGALVSGVLMALVGFSGGMDMGIYTIAVYFFVQNFDGYVVIPMIAKKTVDLAPALVLAAQLVMGVLFGIIGIFLADPLLAMLKVALERRAEENEAKGERVASLAEGSKSGA